MKKHLFVTVALAARYDLPTPNKKTRFWNNLSGKQIQT